MKKSIFVRISMLFTLSACSAAAAGENRPNVLLLIADDLNTWILEDSERYAGKVIAPNIGKLAASGIVFRRAYTASPVCCPSRTALLSGVRPWQSGLYLNGLDASGSAALNKAVSLPGLFKKAGYFTASYGKVGHGWRLKGVWDDDLPHKRDPAPPNAPLLPFTRGEQDWGPTHLPEEKMNDTKMADAAVAQLRRKHDKPFFIACGLFHPHMPWYIPQKYFDMFPPEDVKLPPILENDLDDLPALGREVPKSKRKFVDQVIANGMHEQGVRAYLAATAYVDTQMGRVLDALERSEYRDNTIVVFMSDHGFHLGEKHHWQKNTLWEEATHCNLMVRAPGTTKPKGVCERFVSLQDVYPTLAELCGLEPPAYVEGRSLVPLLQNPGAPWDSTAITSWGDRYLTIRTEKYRYIRYREDQEELYDHAADPHEWTNQIDNKAYAADLILLRSKVPALRDMAPKLRSGRGNGDE
ncbi:MAG: sulfatase [Isosphaeraceae bacterium]|nr:sulfatase [Isosphaeraceae bacterium]